MSTNNSPIITKNPPRTHIRRGGALSVLAAAALAIGSNLLVIFFRIDDFGLALYFGALTPALPLLMLLAWVLNLSGFFVGLSLFLLAILCWYGIGALLTKFVHKMNNQILIWILIYSISSVIGMILFPLLFSD